MRRDFQLPVHDNTISFKTLAICFQNMQEDILECLVSIMKYMLEREYNKVCCNWLIYLSYFIEALCEYFFNIQCALWYRSPYLVCSFGLIWLILFYAIHFVKLNETEDQWSYKRSPET